VFSKKNFQLDPFIQNFFTFWISKNILKIFFKAFKYLSRIRVKDLKKKRFKKKKFLIFYFPRKFFSGFCQGVTFSSKKIVYSIHAIYPIHGKYLIHGIYSMHRIHGI
jgi:hypothetical protein